MVQVQPLLGGANYLLIKPLPSGPLEAGRLTEAGREPLVLAHVSLYFGMLQTLRTASEQSLGMSGLSPHAKQLRPHPAFKASSSRCCRSAWLLQVRQFPALAP